MLDDDGNEVSVARKIVVAVALLVWLVCAYFFVTRGQF